MRQAPQTRKHSSYRLADQPSPPGAHSPGPHCFRHNRLADSPLPPGERDTRPHYFFRHRLAESYPFARRLLHHEPTSFSLLPGGPSPAARRRISTCVVLVFWSDILRTLLPDLLSVHYAPNSVQRIVFCMDIYHFFPLQ